MKTILSGALALALCLTLSLGAFALRDESTQITPDSESQEREVPVSVAVAPTYTVTIPATVTLSLDENGSYTNTVTITAKNVLLEKDKQLNVSIEGGFKMALEGDEDTTVAYQVEVGGSIIATGDSGGSYHLTTFETKSGTQSTEMVFSTKAAPEFAGTYTGTVKFTIRVAEATTDNQ